MIETDAYNRITHFLKKPSYHQVTTDMINAGTYIISSSILKKVLEETHISFEKEIFPRLLIEKRPVFAYSSNAYWIDIGRPESYFKLNRDLLLGKSNRYSLKTPEEVIIGNSCLIAPTSTITGPVIIGDNCSIGYMAVINGPSVIGNNCHITDGATIEESIISHNMDMSRDCHIEKAIIANHCCLGNGIAISDSLLSDNVKMADGYRLKPGSRIEPDSKIKSQNFNLYFSTTSLFSYLSMSPQLALCYNIS